MDGLLTVSQVWFGILLVVPVWLLITARPFTQKVLAIELATVLLISLLLILSFDRSTTHYLDAALVLGLLGFLGTLRFARHLEDWEQGREGDREHDR